MQYYRVAKYLGRILIWFQVLLSSELAVLPWCAVIRIRFCQKNMWNLLHRVHNGKKALKPIPSYLQIVLIFFQFAPWSCLALLLWWAANGTCSSKSNVYSLMQRMYNCKNAYFHIGNDIILFQDGVSAVLFWCAVIRICSYQNV